MNVLGRLKLQLQHWGGGGSDSCAAVMHRRVGAGSCKVMCSSQAPRTAMVAPVQQLYEACKATFPLSTAPSTQSLQQVRLLLDSIKPADVGLEAETPDQQDRGFAFFGLTGRRGRHPPGAPPPISYLHLYEDDFFSMGIFCLPPSAVIPLHNHPGMTVLSKLLYGSMHIKAYDWANPYDDNNKGGASSPRRRQAKLAVDEVMSVPCDLAVLYPDSSNIHAFSAITHCAVLDVLAPPYSAASGRNCTYYRETLGVKHSNMRASEDPDSASVWLEEYQPPDDFVVQRGFYRGPRVNP